MSPVAEAPAGQTSKPSTTSKPKRINNPLRLLILTPSNQSTQTIPVLLQSLTGVPVTPPLSSSSTNEESETLSSSFAGYTTHAPFQISNKYYSADVPIWVDEIPPSSSSSSSSPVGGATAEEEQVENTTPQWKTSFLSDEAREVRDAIGAIVLCVRNPALSISKAVPKEALEIASAGSSSNTSQMAVILEENSKDAAGRGDVRHVKELVGIVSELKTKIEEERNGGDDDVEGDTVGQAEVPGLLVLLDESHSSSLTLKKKQGSGSDEDEGLEAEKPFTSPWWEEILYEQGIFGMEVIQWTPSSSTTDTDAAETRNIYGELEGLPRLKEVLSTHEWTASSSGGIDDDNDDDGDIMSFLNSGTRGDESNGFRFEVNQLEREMMGLRFAINGGDEDNEEEEEDTELQVENLEALMMRMRAIKDMSSDLPESKRKAFAAKAVKDIMREL